MTEVLEDIKKCIALDIPGKVPIFGISMDFDIVLAAFFLWAIPSLIGIIGLWSNRKIFNI